MRKFLMTFGGVAAAMLVLLAVGCGMLVYKGNALDTDGKQYVDASVPAIVAKWNGGELIGRATPELLASATRDQIRSMFARSSFLLGSLVEYQGSRGEARMTWFSGSGSTISAAYTARARFQNGEATFRILLMQRNGQWLIHRFHIDPEERAAALRRT